MMNDKFYFISESLKAKYTYAFSNLSFVDWFKQECPKCGRAVVAAGYRDTTHRLVLEGGKVYPDLLGFGGCGSRLFILSEKAVRVFEENGISGFITESKAELYKSYSRKIIPVEDAPVYYIVSIYGEIDYDYRSMFLKRKHVCTECGQFELNRQRLYPTFFNISTWDGNDLCSLSTFPGRKVCTEKVVEVVKENGLMGFDFKSVTTV